MPFIHAISIALLLLFSVPSVATFPVAKDFSLSDYDKNIAAAHDGKFTVLNSLNKKPDIGTNDKNLKSAIKALAKEFSKKSFEDFLSRKGDTLTVAGFKVESRGLKGEGGFGKVFAIKLIPTEKSKSNSETFEVAVKMLKEVPKELSDRYDLEVEINNMKFVSTLEYDGRPIAAPYCAAFMNSAGQIFILTQLMHHSLAQITKGSRLSDEGLDRVIRSVGFALTILGTLNFVHNDVKPDNIMVDNEGSYYLIDFGTARRLSVAELFQKDLRVDQINQGRGVVFATLGSKAIQPPEKVIHDNSSLAPIDWRKADTYSLGISLLALLTGKSEGAILEGCSTANICQKSFFTFNMTKSDFDTFTQYLATRVIPDQEGDSKIFRAAKHLALKLIKWLPSERPSNIVSAYEGELALSN